MKKKNLAGNPDNPFGNQMLGIRVGLFRDGAQEGNTTALSTVRNILPPIYKKDHMKIQSALSFTERDVVTLSPTVQVRVVSRQKIN